MPTRDFGVLPEGDDVEELDEALHEFVWAYRRSAADTIRDFLDGRLDHGPERVALEKETLEIFEDSSNQIAAVLKRALRS
ncbi:MAG: hypothetical protein ACJ752_14965 [Gaiellaceae bacterium]